MRDEQGHKIPPGSVESASQVAALPYRFEPALEIMLITSRETRRWVLPKGWRMKGLTPHEAAAQEANEEAGLIGEVSEETIGAYTYLKVLKNGDAVPCEVKVFPLRVTGQLDAWIEQHQRDLQWFDPESAASAVAEPELAGLIRAFAQQQARGSSS
jgi:8-oxo-dGTP pyrophosphatase MutT (NUDIX family)